MYHQLSHPSHLHYQHPSYRHSLQISRPHHLDHTCSSTIASKITVTHLPPWEQSFLRHNHRSPNGPSWPSTSLPQIIVGLTSKLSGDTTLYGCYTPFAGKPLLSGSGKLLESPTSFLPRALGTPVALYSALRCLQLLISPTLWSIIKTVTAVQTQTQDIHPFFKFIQLDRHHPSRCCTPFFVWRTLLRSPLSNIIFTIQSPVEMTTPTTVSPYLQAVQAPKSHCHIHENFKLQSRTVCTPDSSRTCHLTHRQCRPCPQQLLNRYHHRPSPSSSPTPPMHPQTLDGLDLLQHPAARLLPIAQEAKTDLTAPDPKFSHGWLPVGRIRHRINPDDPVSCPSYLDRNETCDHVMRCRERRRSPSSSPTPPIRTQPLDGLNLLRNPLARLLPLVQKEKTDLTAPDPKVLPRLATRRPNSTPHQPRRPRLLPQLLGQKRNLRPCRVMPRAPPCRSPFLPDRRPKGPSSQHQNSATSGHRHCTGPCRLVPKPQIPNPNTTV
jgi:hypothetical protein